MKASMQLQTSCKQSVWIDLYKLSEEEPLFQIKEQFYSRQKKNDS